MFTNQDYSDIKKRGIEIEAISRQMAVAACDTHCVELAYPVKADHGVFVVEKTKIDEMIGSYAKKLANKTVLKFVPASGAATRMFKDLYQYLENPQENTAGQQVLDHLSDFACYEQLKTVLKKENLDVDTLLAEKKYKEIIDYLLEEKGLSYAHLPKGLLLFHRYNDHCRTAFEEHLVEAAAYACNENRLARLHFTVSPEHASKFNQHALAVIKHYEQNYEIKFDIGFSYQHAATDTIAVDTHNEPFRDKEGKIVFRPGGHGSLIKNLNDLDADIIFIKNIDNVTIDQLKGDTIRSKKMLAILLVEVQNQLFAFLRKLEEMDNPSPTITNNISAFVKKYFFTTFPDYYDTLSPEKKKQYLVKLLNRPLRVCGIVLNDGEPGGGPFWVKNVDTKISLQIVESSEVNMKNPDQKKIFQQSKFFNPVDIVCAIKNYKGETFDLSNYIDYQRFFVSSKTYNSKPIKAIENPGLWNGAMSDWLTIFVEVPISTFSPVKTFNDLLRKEHLIKK